MDRSERVNLELRRKVGEVDAGDGSLEGPIESTAGQIQSNVTSRAILVND